MYRIAMRTGRDNKVFYVVQKGFKVFGVEKWVNVKSFNEYEPASNFKKSLEKPISD